MKNSNIREKDVEKRLVKKTKTILGGTAYKFTSPSRRSVPDRILLFNGHCIFVECKAPGKTWTAKQAVERDKLQEAGQFVFLNSTYDEVDELIEALKLIS